MKYVFSRHFIWTLSKCIVGYHLINRFSITSNIKIIIDRSRQTLGRLLSNYKVEEGLSWASSCCMSCKRHIHITSYIIHHTGRLIGLVTCTCKFKMWGAVPILSCLKSCLIRLQTSKTTDIKLVRLELRNKFHAAKQLSGFNSIQILVKKAQRNCLFLGCQCKKEYHCNKWGFYKAQKCVVLSSLIWWNKVGLTKSKGQL